MRTSDFDYDLPEELIAQHPAERRDASRLLVLPRRAGDCEHRAFLELRGLLRRGDLLVLNNTRVIPARLRGRNLRTNGSFELLLLEPQPEEPRRWWALVKPGKRANPGTRIGIVHPQTGEAVAVLSVVDVNEEGHRLLEFSEDTDVPALMNAAGEVPLPPYIRRAKADKSAEDRERYQTVYAAQAGSVAAPTAGLHLTHAFLQEAAAGGIEPVTVTLHVGAGTFAPVKVDDPERHRMHEERYSVPAATADAVNAARAARRRVIAVGTTALRALESAVDPGTGAITPQRDARTRLFIRPPHSFRAVDALLTNFHLPCSTLLMLVSAFAAPGELGGRERVLGAYREAIARRYRFFSYGDAMFIA